MRWERFWSDLESQAEGWERDELEAEVVDRVAIERASVLVMDRVRGSVGRRLRCEVAGGEQWKGALLGHGVDWLLLGRADDGHPFVLLPARSLTAVQGLAERALPIDALSLVARRATLSMALRRLASAGERVRLHRAGAAPLAGRIVVVGSDYVEVVDDAEWVVPLAAMTAVELS